MLEVWKLHFQHLLIVVYTCLSLVIWEEIFLDTLYAQEMYPQILMGVYLSRDHFNEYSVSTWICFFSYMFLIQLQASYAESVRLQYKKAG